MKKVVSVLLIAALLFAFSAVNIFAEPELIGSMKGSEGKVDQAEWGDHIDGDSILMDKSGDVIGYEFTVPKAGVYKVALFITVEELAERKQLRVSPRVGSLRCWIDWATTEESRDPMPIRTVMEEEDTDKIILVSVINVPEDGMIVNVGWWQDDSAIIGSCDRVEVANAEYNFANDPEYTLVNEKSYQGNDEAKGQETKFNEDPQQKLLAAEDSWTPSVADEKEEPGDEPTEEPTQAPTEEPTETPAPTEEPTQAPTETPASTAEPTEAPTQTPDAAPVDDSNGFPVWVIAVIVVVVVAAGAACYFLVIKKKK